MATKIKKTIDYGWSYTTDEDLSKVLSVGENVIFDTKMINPVFSGDKSHMSLRVIPKGDINIDGSEANNGKGFGVKIEYSADKSTYRTILDESITATTTVDLGVESGSDILRNGDISWGFSFPLETARYIKITIPDLETSGIDEDFDVELVKFGL